MDAHHLRLRFRTMLAAAFFLFLLGESLADRYFNSLVEDCIPVADYQSGFLFFPQRFQLVGDTVDNGVEIEVAEDFTVRYEKTFKVVHNLRVNETYVLYQCGTEVPDLTGLPKTVKVFEIPLTYVALADVTSSSFLAELGVIDRVKAASAYATEPCLQKVTRRCGRIAQDPASLFADAAQLRVQNRRADAVFVSGASNDSKSIAFTATMDPAVLKRAEWVKFVSLFFNKEPEANRFFDAIAEKWRDSGIASNKGGPRVAWISYQDYDGRQFFIHFAPYKVDYIRAAGGRLLETKSLKKANGVTPTLNGYLIEFGKRRGEAVAQLHAILRDVDVVIDETYQPNNTAYDMDAFSTIFGFAKDSDFAFITEKRVFRLDGMIAEAIGGGDVLDWYETGVARPDLVLKDLQKAFGTAKHQGHRRTWLRNLSKGEKPKVLSHKDCLDFKWCHVRPEAICPAVQVNCVGDIEYRNDTEQSCQPLTCN